MLRQWKHAEHVDQQRQQEQQQQQSSMSFTDVLSQASLVWHIATHLVLRDAAALALSAKHAAGALRGCLHSNSKLALCPRIIIAASGSSKLLELPLTHDGQVYQSSGSANAAAGVASAGPAATAAAVPARSVIREVAARQRKKRKRRPKLTMTKSSDAMWLTGIAVGPWSKPAADVAAADADNIPDQALFVCDYSIRGVLRFCASSLRPLGVFASGPELKHPEAITWVGSTCYVASAGNGSIVSLDCQGRVQQVLRLSEGSLPDVPWGMTAWQPQGSTAAAAPAAEGISDDGGAAAAASPATETAAASLFLAADVEYFTARYTQPPEDTTGGVVRVVLSSSGAMLGPPQLFSRVCIRRPSGLSFDDQGHLWVTCFWTAYQANPKCCCSWRLAGNCTRLPCAASPPPCCSTGQLWVTSLDGLLLRLAGPASPAPGSLLQTLHLRQLLPSPADTFLPFDVLAMPLPITAATRSAAVPGMCPAGVDAGMGGAGTDRQQQAVKCGGTQLVVTLHRGPPGPGAVAVFRFGSTNAQQGAEQESIEVAACGTAAGADGEQQQVAMTLVALVMQHRALKEPNMIALL